jgi:hypothetical protein
LGRKRERTSGRSVRKGFAEGAKTYKSKKTGTDESHYFLVFFCVLCVTFALFSSGNPCFLDQVIQPVLINEKAFSGSKNGGIQL